MIAPKTIALKPALIPPKRRNKNTFFEDKEEIETGDYTATL